MSPHRSVRPKRRVRESGQAVVEFAMIATLLLVLLCASIDFGRALKGKRALTKKAFDATTEEVVQLVIRACGAISPAQRRRNNQCKSSGSAD